MTFKELNLSESIQNALQLKGYINPTPIQEKSIPHILNGSDLFACAQTGTGKTAAFALPILQKLSNRKSESNGIKALVLAPTRELAVQISENFTFYGRNLNLKQALIFGGVSQFSQVNALKRGVDIVIATPGRLLDLMQQGHVKLNTVEFLVLDEADRMLDMGFINDIKRIISKIPAKRQTLFFSATIPDEIKKLAESMLNNPLSVSTTPVSSASENVKQSLFYVSRTDKNALLQHILSDKGIEHALVFTRTKREADKVAKELKKNLISAEAIHGNKSQNARQNALKGFKNRTIRVLVATDIASRGIDVEKLSHVINYNLPQEAETYIHRIGRTGRAGANGMALTFCDQSELQQLKLINRLLKRPIDVNDEHPYVENSNKASADDIKGGSKKFRKRVFSKIRK